MATAVRRQRRSLTDAWTQLLQYRLIHGGRVRNYEDVAAYFDVHLCDGSDCVVPIARHKRGAVVLPHRIVHWADRKLTKPGLRRFLKLVAQIRILNYNHQNQAMRLFAENTWAAQAAQALHVRFPARYSTADRAKARWLIATGEPVSAPAYRWAHRQEKP